jgi:hypothetical protein
MQPLLIINTRIKNHAKNTGSLILFLHENFLCHIIQWVTKNP